MYQKDVPGNPLGLLMGVRVVDGVTPFEIYSALSTPGVRSVWEKDLYDTSSIKEVLSKRASLVYALFKGFVRARTSGTPAGLADVCYAVPCFAA